MADTILHIANMNGSQLIKEFYEKCGTEVIDGTATPINEIKMFSHLEELFDNIIGSGGKTHVIIAHGNADHGLLIKFARESFHNATGLIIGTMAALAEQFPLGPFLKQIRVDVNDPRIKELAKIMGVQVATLARLFEQLGIIRNHHYNFAFRGCNVGNNPDLLRLYKKVFSAQKVSAPACRNLFLRIRPSKPFNTTMGNLADSSKTPTTPRTRRRMFFDPTYGIANGEPIVIDVQDLDGHTNVSSKSFMNLPNLASNWGKELNLNWKQAPTGTGNNQFIVQVMWDDLEASYHCRKDQSYRFKIVSV